MRMTREEARRRAELYSALVEGKTIQVQNPNGTWEDIKIEGLDHLYDCNKYRIKPKYRPFKTREECWEEMHKHPDFGWVKVKVNVTCEYEQIVRIFDYCKTELCFNIANSDDDYTSEMMLNSYTFTDDTPFGVKE